MPQYKFRRDDIVRTTELDSFLNNLTMVDWLGLDGIGWKALGALHWVFGKRVSEIVCLKGDEIYIDDGDLCVRFFVLKKRQKNTSPIATRNIKRISVQHKYVDPIVRHWSRYQGKHGFIFPSNNTKTGHIHRQRVWDVFKKVNPKISSHIFRHSLATLMAENGASILELKDWFDWEKIEQATNYVQRAGRISDKLSRREY